jgi:protein TonB
MKPKRPGVLPVALGVSVALHAAVLAVHFADPPATARRFDDAPLEVVLVNARPRDATDPSERPEALAQHTLAGGGTAAERGRSTSPLPRSAFAAEGDAAEDARRQAEAAPAETRAMLSRTAPAEQATATPPTPPRPEAASVELQATLAPEDRQQQLVDQLAEIERRLNRDNAQPRKRYVSPATREAVYAAYVDRLRRRIEARGTQNFPELAGRKLYGELTMLVTVDAEGRLLGAEILQGSGIDVLDRRAQAIVTGIGGFGRFSEAMRAQADQIVLPSRFQFGRDETLKTSR